MTGKRPDDVVLAVAAHPDDELLGAGGIRARHARRGAAVHAFVRSDGASSRHADGMAELLATSARRGSDANADHGAAARAGRVAVEPFRVLREVY